MSKKPEIDTALTEDEAFEMIELAADEIDLLALAFDVIAKACDDFDAPVEDELPPGVMIH